MGIDRLYRVCCEFCHCVGPIRETEVLAVKAGRESHKHIVCIHRTYYGNEVWACAECVSTDHDARQWASLGEQPS